MDGQVLDVIEQLERFMATVDDAMAIPRDAAEFTHALVLATRPKLAVEIGTSYGYSGLWIASAFRGHGGRLITIDHLPRKTEAALTRFGAAGLMECIEARTGKALDILPSVRGPIDFVLNDADKENCIRYIDMLADRLSDRAVVLTDNVVSHAAQLAEFVEWIRGHPCFASARVPVGNGMEMSVKLGGGRG